MARHKDFGTIRVRIQLPSNDDQKAIVGGVESKLNDIGGDIVTSMLAIITGNNQKKPIGDIFNKGISIGNDGTLFSNVHSINEGISQIVNILNDTKGSSVLANMLTDLDFICAKIVKDANDSKGATATLAIDTSNAGNLEQIIEEIKNLSSDTKSINIDGLIDIESFFIMLNELTNKDGIITQAVNNTNNIPNLSKKANKNIHSLTAFLTAMNTLASLDPKKLKDGADNIKDIVDYLNQVLADIGQSDIEDNIKTVKKSFELIRELYDDDIKVTAEAVKSHAADLSAIKLGLGDTYETVIESGDKMSSWDMDDFEVTAGDVAGAIALMGFVMLIGGMIIRDHPELILESIKFGGVLAVFLLELSVPIVLLGALNSKFDASFESLSDLTLFITVASFVMLIGASVMKNKTMWARSLLFGVVFTLFLTGILGAIWFTSRNLDPKLFENLNKLSVLIVTCTLVMLIGAYFVKSGWWKNALEFGGILALFIGAILLPFALYGFLFKKTIEIAQGIVQLILLCTVIMLIAAYFVKTKEIWANSLQFGILLGAFLLCVTIPILGLALFKEKAEDTINAVRKYIITSIIIMMLGVVFMNLKGGKYVLDALQFGVVFGLFILATVAPILLFGILGKKASKLLLSVTVFILTCAAVLYLGAMMSERGMFNEAWKFAATLAGFIFAILLPFKWLGKSGSLDKAWPLLISLSLFVITCGYVMTFVTKTISENSWKNALIAVGILDAYIISLIGICIGAIKLMDKWGIDDAKILRLGKMLLSITVIIGITILSVWLLKTSHVGWKEVGLFAVINAIVAGMLALVMVISKMKDTDIKNALKAMLGISVVLLITIGLIFLVQKLDYNRIYKTLIIFGIINGIVAAMLSLVMVISKMKNTNVYDAIKTMLSISLVLVITIGLIYFVQEFIDSETIKQTLGIFAVINVIIVAMLALVMIISKMKNTNVNDAIAIMWSTTILIALTVGIIYFIKLAKIDETDIWNFGLINLIVGLMAGTVVLIGWFGSKDKDIVKNGILILGLVTVCLIGLALAIVYMAKSGVDWKHIGMLYAIEGAVVVLTAITIGIGILLDKVKNKEKFYESLFIVSLMTACVIGLALGISEIAKAGVEWKHVGMLYAIEGAVVVLVGLVFAIGAITSIPGVKTLLAIGAVIIAAAVGVVLLIGIAMRKIADAAKAADEVKNPEAIGQVLSAFFNSFKDLSLGSMAKILLVGKKVAKTIDLLTEPLAKVVNIIKDISSMKIAIAWDNKGRPIEYRELTPEDFTGFSNSIAEILTVIPRGFVEASKSVREMTGGLFKKNVLNETVDFCNRLGEVIANITTGLKSYAKLLIPDQWDPTTGKPIHYTLMTEQHFDDAANGIKKIIVTMSKGIYVASEELKNMKQKQIEKTIENCLKIGKLISNISKAIISYSKLIIPDEWDPETGKAKHYHLMNENDFTEAGNAISKILLVMTQGVIDAHAKYEAIMTPRQFKKIVSSFDPIGKLISDTGEGIKDLVELSIPIYDDNGKVIGKQRLGEEDFKKVGENLSILMSATSQGIVDANRKIHEGGLDPTSKEFKRIVESFTPIGEFISSVAVGIKEYASATYTDKDGNKITIDKIFIEKAGENIGLLLTTVSDALINYYNGPDNKGTNKEFFEKGILKNIATQYKETIEVINNIITSIKNIASVDTKEILSAIPVIDLVLNGQKDENGKTKSILNILIESLNTQSDFNIIKENIQNTKETLTSIFSIISMISTNSENIKKIANNDYELISYVSVIITKIKLILDDIIAKTQDFKESNKKAIGINGLFELFDLVNGNISTSINKLSTLIQSINKLDISKLTYISDSGFEESIIYKIIEPINDIVDIVNSENIELLNKDNLNNLRKNINSVEQIMSRMIICLDKISEFDKIYKKTMINEIPFVHITRAIKEFTKSFKEIETNLTDKSQEISLKNLNKIERKVESFSEIVRNIIKAASGSIQNEQIFDQIKEGIKKINTEIDNVNDETTDKLNKEVKSLDKFVKSVDRIDLTRVTKLTSLMEAMANLADKMGGFDKLAELLDGDLKEVLNGLANTVDEAKKTIETSEKINKQRQAELKKNLEKFSELMDKNILVGVSEMDKDGNLKVSSEKLKKS